MQNGRPPVGQAETSRAAATLHLPVSVSGHGTARRVVATILRRGPSATPVSIGGDEASL